MYKPEQRDILCKQQRNSPSTANAGQREIRGENTAAEIPGQTVGPLLVILASVTVRISGGSSFFALHICDAIDM